MTTVLDTPRLAKRSEYNKLYRQKNKNKLNECHNKYYHSKKKKGEKEKEDNEDDIQSE